ncbi:hypothetical protein VTI28DRAFT_7825 [Corynascus sepedonium]
MANITYSPQRGAVLRTAVFDMGGRQALAAQFGGLLYPDLHGYHETAMGRAIIPRPHAWRMWRESAYRAYLSSWHRLADARFALNFVQKLELIDTPEVGDGQGARRAADKHMLDRYLQYILHENTSPAGNPDSNSMDISYREILSTPGGVDINSPISHGFTALQRAVLSGDRDVVKSVNVFSVGIDATGHTPGWTPLWLSVFTGQGAVAQLLHRQIAGTPVRRHPSTPPPPACRVSQG